MLINKRYIYFIYLIICRFCSSLLLLLPHKWRVTGSIPGAANKICYYGLECFSSKRLNLPIRNAFFALKEGKNLIYLMLLKRGSHGCIGTQICQEQATSKRHILLTVKKRVRKGNKKVVGRQSHLWVQLVFPQAEAGLVSIDVAAPKYIQIKW